MAGSQSSLRAAFWAMVAALGLSLLLALSDPYAVRRSLLAHREPAGRSSAESTASTRIAAHQTPGWDGHTGDSGALDRLLSVTSERVAAFDRDDFPAELGEKASGNSLPPVDSMPATSRLDTWTVSSGERAAARGTRVPANGSAMPIVAPSHLSGERPRGEFIELPPPPETGRDLSSSPETGIGNALSQEFSGEPDLKHRRLETDLADLRREVDRISDGSLNRQLQDLQSQHDDLLQLQQATAERVDQLFDELHKSTARIEALLDRQSVAPLQHGPSF